MMLKEKYEDYTEAEFLDFLSEFFENKHNLKGEAYRKHIQKLVSHFEKITEHPAKSDLIFYPATGTEDSPQGILTVVEVWRAANGKPGLKR